MVNVTSTDDPAAAAWAVASGVPDPEIPAVNIADLGILRSVTINDAGQAVAKITPTYAGCTGIIAVEMAIEAALREAGFEPKVEWVISPPWTSDWITPAGRKKLLAHGIAPPVRYSNSIRTPFGETTVDCPRCSSEQTECVSEFGSTLCVAVYRCTVCAEPFNYFKCI